MMKVHRNANAPDSTWQTVAECKVHDAACEEEVQASLCQLSTAVLSLQLPAARVAQLEAALSGAAQNAAVHASGAQCNRALSMRVLAPSMELKRLGMVHGMDHEMDHDDASPIFSHSPSRAVEGLHGWGFFLIEKTAGICQPGDAVHYMIDLFLYVEGEVD